MSDQRVVTVYDHRRKKRSGEQGEAPKFMFKLESDHLPDLVTKLVEKIGNKSPFVLTLPNRTPVDVNNFKDPQYDQLWILNDFNQKLKSAVGTPIKFPPHYHTITESGMYEYYDSRGIDSLVISLAELIDNSLAATKKNDGLRHIEIRYYDNGTDSMVIIMDNGHGMDFTELHDWARFKYSKFERKKVRASIGGTDGSDLPDSSDLSFSSQDLPLRPHSQSQNPIPNPQDRRPRYLDSEINYFGAGGKQAIFNIGCSTTMISKTARNRDVVELTLSRKKFDVKAQKDVESVYRDNIYTRSRGVERELQDDASVSDYILNNVIKEIERQYKNFTICCIQDVFEKHHPQFKKNNENTSYWTKGLARIYHYYLHGPKGNIPDKPVLPPDLRDINIVIQVYNVNKSSNGEVETSLKHTINLKEIYDDFETALVRSAADTFEFEVEHYSKAGVVIEGVIRYYPYLYDRETLPLLNTNEELGETSSHVSGKTGATEANLEEVLNGQSKTKHREAFECFWHGRLIPQDCIDFEWTKFDPKNNNIKGYEDCYNRLSGALFTNHAFQVSQNKQSFMDLNKLMAKKDNLTFYRVNEEGNRRPFRVKFENDFITWIKNCHNKYDKQVLYKEYIEEVPRNDLPSLKKNSLTDSYSSFAAINWRDRDWKKGQYIQTKGTKPAGLIGQINRFLIPKCVRNSLGNFMGSPGFIEIYQVPEEIYGKGAEASKILTFKQINVEVTDETIDADLAKLYERLPHEVQILFPEGYEIEDGTQMIAGNPIGVIQVFVKNKNGVKLPSDRFPFKTTNKRIKVRAQIYKIEDNGKESVEVDYPCAQHLKDYGYWFIRNDDGIKRVGKYRLNCVCAESEKELLNFANGQMLPASQPINFTVVAAPPENFSIRNERLIALVGQQFDLTLDFTDDFENPTKPGDAAGRPVLSIDKLKVDFDQFETFDDRAVIKNIVIYGHITENQNPSLKVSLPEINKTQEIIVNLQRGHPSQIRLWSTKLEFINGEVPELGLLLFDKGGNEVTFDKHCSVFCRIFEGESVPVTPEYSLVENMHNNKRALVLNKQITVRGTDIAFNLRKFFIRFYMKTTGVHLQQELVLKKNSKPSYVRLYFTNTLGDNSEAIEIPNGEIREFPANSRLAGVHFKAFDCDDSPIDLSDFKDQTVAIGWYNKPALITEEGGLPNIHIHTNCSEERLMTFSWKQQRKAINVDYSFTLRPYPDSPQRMAINTNSHSLVFPVGVVVAQSIQVSVLDAYNNTIRSADIMRRLVMKAVTQKIIVDDKSMKKVLNNVVQNSISFVISNIKLLPNPSLTENDSVIGETKLEFSIQGYPEIIENIDINVVNGPPNCLNWLIPHKCLNVMNNRRHEIRVQLTDEYKNPVVDNKLPVTLSFGPNFINKEVTAETDNNGVAVFSQPISIDMKSKKPNKCNIGPELERELQPRCIVNCFGLYKMQAITKFKQKLIKSRYQWLHMTCDNKNPVRIDCRVHGSLNVIAYGQDMPSFTVRLFAEDQSLICDFDPNKIEMHLINIRDDKYQVLLPIPPFKGATFRFRVDRAPVPGTYQVVFVCYAIGNNTIRKPFHELVKVMPDCPIKLLVKSEPLNKLTVVSNVGIDRQILKSSLTLDLVDRHDFSIHENVSDECLESRTIYSGNLSATIINYYEDTDDRVPVPQLDGCNANNFKYFSIRKGRVIIKADELRLRESTQGQTNTPYLVELRTHLRDEGPRVEAFHIKIMFCDDTGRQQQLNQIQNNIAINQSLRDDIQKVLDAKKKDIRRQNTKFNKVRDREKELVERLKNLNEKSDFTDAQRIENKTEEYQQKLNTLNARLPENQFRGKEIPNAPEIEGVIGKIVHLAYIQEEGCARSLSWFLRNHLNSVVVQNAQLAELLLEDHGIQSILSLDIISDKLPDFYVPPPHERGNSVGYFRFSPSVSLVRSRLKLNETLSEMKNILENVFISILGDTLFTNELKTAKLYRNMFQKFPRLGNCPTIVAKDGILYDNGIIEMVPKEDDFVWFQSPPDRDQIKVQKILDILNDLGPVHTERIAEYQTLDRLESEYKHLKDEKLQQITDLDQTIRENTTQFANISHTPLELLDEDSNHSNHSHYRRSPEGHRRRRSYRSSSRSMSGEPSLKRSRQSSHDY